MRLEKVYVFTTNDDARVRDHDSERDGSTQASQTDAVVKWRAVWTESRARDLLLTSHVT